MIAALAFLLCFSLVAALRVPQPLLRRAKANLDLTPVLPAASSLLLPSAVFAADGGAVSTVSIPIVISLLTFVPFLYYANGTVDCSLIKSSVMYLIVALKPKERTVKQIELDENLRAKDKTLSKGSTSTAKATKK